jgi:hypothetical protein
MHDFARRTKIVGMKPLKVTIVVLATFAGFCFGSVLSEKFGYHWSAGRAGLAIYLVCACTVAAVSGIVGASVRLPK